jgi:hypothetical protein
LAFFEAKQQQERKSTMIQRVEVWLIIVVAVLSIFSQGFFSSTETKDQGDKDHQGGAGQAAKPNPWLRDDKNENGEHHAHSDDDHHRDDHDDAHHSGGYSSALAPREEQIAQIQQDLEYLRDGRMRDSLSRAHRSKQLLDQAKSNAGWIFKSDEEKQRIERLDTEHNRDLRAVAEVKAEEKALEARIKPLYGIVSAPFYIEQRNTIRSCVAKVQEVAYNQAWYSGLFNAHRAESITDLLLQFLIEWLMGYVLMYPFAVGYYALWAAPWSIYEYSSGVVDVVPAVIVWVLGVGVMLLPLIALFGGGYLIFVKYGEQIAESMRRRAEEAQRRQQGPRPRPHAVGH